MEKKPEKTTENKNIKEITLTVEGQEWEEALDKAYEKASKKVKIDGFRQGKAPKEIFLKKYGKESLFMDAADIAVQTGYDKMMKENKDLAIVAQPDGELIKLDEKGLEFKFTLTLKPEVKLGAYKNLKVQKEKVEVTKEEIDHTIEHMKERFSENRVKEGKIAEGNIAIIDFEGFQNGVAFDGGKGENYSLTIGSHTFIPGFEEQLIGLEAGEEKELNVTFPEDYHQEDLKGKPVVFKVKVIEVKEVVIPEIDEEFFEDLGMEGIDTLEALEAQVKENLQTRKEQEIDNKYLDDLLEAASKNVEVEIPEVMIKEEVDRMLKQYEQNLSMQGLTLELFFQYTNSTEEQLREQMSEEANKRVLFRLMLEEIAKTEKIVVSEAEALEEATKQAEKYQMTIEEFQKALGGLEMVKYDLEMRKAMDILKGN